VVNTGNTTSTTLANVIATVLSRAKDVIEKPTVMSEFVTKVKLEDGAGLTYNWPKFATKLDAQALAEGTPINNPQKLIPSSRQFTTSEVGVHVVLTDKAIRVTPEKMVARAGRFMGNAMKRKKETDLLSLFSGLSRDLGTANNPFNPQFLSAGYARLTAAAESGQSEPVEGRVYAVLQNFAYHDILASGATLGSNINTSSGYFPIEGLTEELVRNYRLKELYDCVIALAPLISIDGSDDAVSAIFGEEAFILVNTSVSMRMERERDIFMRGEAMVITSEYGTGELDDQMGIKLTADATAPVV